MTTKYIEIDRAIETALLLLEEGEDEQTLAYNAALVAFIKNMENVPAAKVIKNLPPAQPEIIRGKDCKYYRWEINMCDEPFSTAHNVVHEYDYCSKAERKTDG